MVACICIALPRLPLLRGMQTGVLLSHLASAPVSAASRHRVLGGTRREEETGRGMAVANRLAQNLRSSAPAGEEPPVEGGPGADHSHTPAMRITINIGRTELELLRTTNEVCTERDAL